MMLRSIDVLHDFYVPEFRAKMDMVPGTVTYFWFTPTRTGEFEILCAELCGVGHAYMRGYVQVVDEADYEAWLQEQQTFAELSTDREGEDRQRRPVATARRRDSCSDRRLQARPARAGRSSEMVNVTDRPDARVPPAEVPDVHPPHAHSWIDKWVFSQDAKYIAIQYSGTAISIGLVALVLSWLMRLQLGFPDTSSSSRPRPTTSSSPCTA